MIQCQRRYVECADKKLMRSHIIHGKMETRAHISHISQMIKKQILFNMCKTTCKDYPFSHNSIIESLAYRNYIVVSKE